MAEETRWYSLRVISGKEKGIKERIEKEIKIENWGDFVRNIVVPTEKVYKIRNGKKVIQERNTLPGYIMIEALPSKIKGDIATAITNVPNVIHFLSIVNRAKHPFCIRNRHRRRVVFAQKVNHIWYICNRSCNITFDFGR